MALLSTNMTWPTTQGEAERFSCRDEEVATIAMVDKIAEDTAAGEPQTGQPAARRVRHGEVRVFGHWCKGCGLCIAFCPRNVFVAGADGHPLALYPERCTACMWCTEHCPDFAIKVQPREAEEEARRDAA